MTAILRFGAEDTIPVVTGDALCYNGVGVEFTGAVDSATGYPIVIIGTADTTDAAGVVDCGRVDGQKGTSTSKYASGSTITVRRTGVVVMTDSGSGTTAKQYAQMAASGEVAGTATFDASANIGRILNAADADGDVYVALTIR